MPTFTQLIPISFLAATLINLYLPSHTPGLFATATLLFSLLFVTKASWLALIYPKLFSPLRHIATPSDNDFLLGQTKSIFREAGGRPMRRWIETVKNDGLIAYSAYFRQRVLVTNPKTLAEVLVTKNYEVWVFCSEMGIMFSVLSLPLGLLHS